MSELKRYYPAASINSGVWMEEVHPNRETEDGHYYKAADAQAAIEQARELGRREGATAVAHSEYSVPEARELCISNALATLPPVGEKEVCNGKPN